MLFHPLRTLLEAVDASQGPACAPPALLGGKALSSVQVLPWEAVTCLQLVEPRGKPLGATSHRLVGPLRAPQLRQCEKVKSNATQSRTERYFDTTNGYNKVSQNETGRWKSRRTVPDLLSAGRCVGAVLDFLSFTDVGRLVPPLEEGDDPSQVPECELRDRQEREEGKEAEAGLLGARGG